MAVDLEKLQAAIPDWLPTDAEALGWFAVVVVLSWVGTIVALPLIVAWIPVDYFSSKRRHTLHSEARHPLVGWLLAALKNVFGFVLILLGILMLLTPGQGILTILVGLMLMNFPGKYRLERWLVRKPGVLKSLNWLRERPSRTTPTG